VISDRYAPTALYRKHEVCIPFRLTLKEGDSLSEPVLISDFKDPQEGSIVLSMIQWELFSFSPEELLDVLFYGSLRVNFLNCYFDYPLLNQKPKEVTPLSALVQIVQGAAIIEELNERMASKWNSVGSVVSATGCQLFLNTPLLIPSEAFCKFQLLSKEPIRLTHSLRIAVNLHGTHQTTIHIG
jgi:hypothetical protein